MLLFAISLISAGAIGYEILLMRLYSIVQWHHFAFMIISIALMGYGASGTFLAFARSRLLRHFLPAWRISAVLFGISAYGGFALTQRLAFNPLEITWEPRQLLLLSATYALLLLPFFFAATCIGLAFARHGGRIGPIYAADLGGAGLGALAAVLLMTLLPPEYGLTAALALGVLAAACISLDRQTPVWIALAVAAGILAPHDWVEPQLSEYKGLRAALFAPQAEIIAERHSPLGEITVVESPAVPFRSAPGLSLTSPHTPPEQLGVFIDGEGPQPIVRFTGDRGDIAYLDYTTEAAPYHAQDAERVLVLNAGTGVPVLLARYHGAGHIDAVEANPSLAHLLRTRFADYAGHIYNRPPVELHVAEARTFIAASHERYDLIHVPLSASRGGSIMSGLNETYTYTTDALRSYLDHLAPDGILALTREVKNPPRDALKLMAAAIDALSARGVQDPGRRLVLIRSWQTFTLLIGNEPFDEKALGALRRFMSERSFDAGWYPGMKREDANRYNVLDTPQFYDGAKALLGGERRRFMSDYKFNLRPASDNRPYFNILQMEQPARADLPACGQRLSADGARLYHPHRHARAGPCDGHGPDPAAAARSARGNAGRARRPPPDRHLFSRAGVQFPLYRDGLYTAFHPVSGPSAVCDIRHSGLVPDLCGPGGGGIGCGTAVRGTALETLPRADGCDWHRPAVTGLCGDSAGRVRGAAAPAGAPEGGGDGGADRAARLPDGHALPHGPCPPFRTPAGAGALGLGDQWLRLRAEPHSRQPAVHSLGFRHGNRARRGLLFCRGRRVVAQAGAGCRQAHKTGDGFGLNWRRGSLCTDVTHPSVLFQIPKPIQALSPLTMSCQFPTVPPCSVTGMLVMAWAEKPERKGEPGNGAAQTYGPRGGCTQ
ncbi:MAG: hypothetical protein ACLFWF_07735 [Alphaproteobacteria bacterium]